jgi:RNA polymerase sigma-70 factor (ECF subfamily)
MLPQTLAQAKIWDMSAFGVLYDESYDRVYRYIFHRTLDTTVTEDIMSEVFTKALKNIKKFRGETEGEYYAWMFQISYTTLIDFSRKEIWIDSLEEIEWEIGYEEEKGKTLDMKEKLAEILEYMKTFTEKERAIITMKIWDDLSYEQISTITWEKEPTIRKILSRALSKIAANITLFNFLIFIIHYVS